MVPTEMYVLGWSRWFVVVEDEMKTDINAVSLSRDGRLLCIVFIEGVGLGNGEVAMNRPTDGAQRRLLVFSIDYLTNKETC